MQNPVHEAEIRQSSQATSSLGDSQARTGAAWWQDTEFSGDSGAQSRNMWSSGISGLKLKVRVIDVVIQHLWA